MTKQDRIKLAQRAVASPHFRLLRGMIGLDGTVILGTSPLVETSEIVEWRDGGTMRRENRECTWSDLRDGGWLPDLLEPATMGCFLSLVLPLCDAEAADLVAAMHAALVPEEK